MEGLIEMVNLRKLYLERNCISKLDGLDNCRYLEELYIGNQDLEPDEEFTFDEYSLAAISGTLKVLDIPNTNIANPKPLYYLEQLETLNMKENLINDFENQVCPLLQTMNCLKTLDLRSNPCCKITKYRDQIVLLSKSVAELDGKDILDSERKYLFNLISRKKIGATVYNDVKKKKDEMKIDGHNLEIHEQKKFLLDNM